MENLAGISEPQVLKTQSNLMVSKFNFPFVSKNWWENELLET